MRHLFVTQNFPPDMGGMERMNVELARRLAKAPDMLVVSTVAAGPGGGGLRRGGGVRDPPAALHLETRQDDRELDALGHVGSRAGPARDSTSSTSGISGRPGTPLVGGEAAGPPYVLYVVGHDLIKDVRKARKNAFRRAMTRSILGDAAGVVAISDWVADLAKESMREVGVKRLPPVATIDLGTDPSHFSPARDTGALRKRYGLEGKSLLVTVSRLYAAKGQDTGIRALALLSAEFPDLRYLVVGDGESRERLEGLAKELGVGAAGRLRGAARRRRDRRGVRHGDRLRRPDAERGVARRGLRDLLRRGGGERRAVRGRRLGGRPRRRARGRDRLRRPARGAPGGRRRGGPPPRPGERAAMGKAARRAVETHWNWDRAGAEARAFAASVVEARKGIR